MTDKITEIENKARKVIELLETADIIKLFKRSCNELSRSNANIRHFRINLLCYAVLSDRGYTPSQLEEFEAEAQQETYNTIQEIMVIHE